MKGASNLARRIQKEFSKVDRLILNAGIWPTEKRIDADGLEEGLMINFRAQYMICDEPLPALSKNAPSQIVFVGAGLYAKGQADMVPITLTNQFLICRYRRNGYSGSETLSLGRLIPEHMISTNNSKVVFHFRTGSDLNEYSLYIFTFRSLISLAR